VVQILALDRGVSDAEIKSSYRKLSLLYHPDKNPGNEEAARKFMEVSKAYETLTDPTAKENWELYGNPDGKQSLAVRAPLHFIDGVWCSHDEFAVGSRCPSVCQAG
jgi:DnaJ-class molecular chaperone